eukprot:gene24-4275_t
MLRRNRSEKQLPKTYHSTFLKKQKWLENLVNDPDFFAFKFSMKEMANLQQILFDSWITNSISLIFKKYNLVNEETLVNVIVKKFLQECFEPTTNVLGIYFMDNYLELLKVENNGKINLSTTELITIYSASFLLCVKFYEDTNLMNSQFFTLYNLSKENITLKSLQSFEFSILTKLDYRLNVSPDDLFDYMISLYSDT